MNFQQTKWTQDTNPHSYTWGWLDAMPNGDPLIDSLKAANATTGARTAIFIWADGSMAKMTCYGSALSTPPVTDEMVYSLYAIGRAQRLRLETEEGGLHA